MRYTNPAPVVAPDGTFHVVVRRCACNHFTWYTAKNATGPWKQESRPVFSSDTDPYNVFDEDSFMWINERDEWHMLTHRSITNGKDSAVDKCGGGHMYSKDGKDWYMGHAQYDCSAQWADGNA